MIFFVVFSMMGLAFVKMASHESVQATYSYDRVRAFYNAEAGIHRGLWLANKVSTAAATFSDATVSVVFDSAGLKLTATGIAGSILDSIRVTLNSSGGTSTGGWPYAIFTDTKDLKLNEGTGTITGDVHSNTGIESDAGYTITGTSTTSPYVAPPTITWSFFQALQLPPGSISTSDQTFDAAGSPYTGVWYTTKKALIKASAVINGTVVAEDDINFKGDGSTITASPDNYPVLLSQAQINGENHDNIQVTGLVYVGDHFDKDFDDFTLTGAIIALQDFHHNSSNFVITYDDKYTTNVAGTDIGGTPGSLTYTIKIWEDL